MVADRSVVRSLPAICQFGRYELLGRIAVGGMAEIFLARERENVSGAGDRHLVIKRVLSHVADDETFQSMFFDEARLAMRLQHPAIVHIYEFGEEAGATYLAMEWVEGVALGKLIRRARSEGGIPPAVAVKLIANVAEALHYAHRVRGDDGQPLGIVHRDVSPQNIMISYEGSVKLLDFGIAKATDQMSRTSDGQVKGKFAYMAPEQCVGDPVDGRADVFALGVCLHEALTGRPLYHRKTQYETMRAVLEDAVPTIMAKRPGLSEELNEIVLKALSKDADQRFQSAGEFQVALEHWLARQQEVVPATRIAEFVGRVFVEGSKTPQIDSTPFGQSFRGSIPSAPPVAVVRRSSSTPAPPVESAVVELASSELMAASEEQLIDPSGAALAAEEPEEKKRALWAWLAFGVALVAMSVGAAWFLAQSRGEEVAAPVQAATPVPVAAVGPSDMAPAETTPAAPDPGGEASPAAGAILRVESRPSGAAVQVDGELRGETPLRLDGLPLGEHAVVISHPRFQTWEGNAVLVEGQSLTLERRLRRGRRVPMNAMVETPAAEMGMTEMRVAEMRPSMESAERGFLAINTRPWSRVYLGSRLLGTTPLGRVEVPAGAVRLRFEDRDGETHRRTVQVRAGELSRQFVDFTE